MELQSTAKIAFDPINDQPTSPSHWIWRNGTKRQIHCLACGAENTMTHVVTVENVPLKEDFAYYQCENCTSLAVVSDFFTKAHATNAYNSTIFGDEFVRHYLQIGAGIDSIIRPLERMSPENNAALLDIGCGFGFMLDYWKEIIGGEAIGLEPSYYGDPNKNCFNVTIFKKYLENATEIKKKHFDYAGSSEVIEHTPKPLEFLKSCRSHLKHNGTLFLTTPNAAIIKEDSPVSVAIAALSPGGHTLLFSKSALENLIKQAGFKYSLVEATDANLIAYASNVPLVLKEPRSYEKQAHKNYVRYLEIKTKNKEKEKYFDLVMGCEFRLFKELVNDGEFEKALPHAVAIREQALSKYSLDLFNVEQCRKFTLQLTSFPETADKVPFFIGPFTFYLSMCATHIHKPDIDPANGFNCAAEICKHFQSISFQFSQEAASLYWTALYEEGMARLIKGDRDSALALMQNIIHGTSEAVTDIHKMPRSGTLVTRAILQSGVALLQDGRMEEAISHFQDIFKRPANCSDSSIREEAYSLLQIALHQSVKDAKNLDAGALCE